MGHFPGMGEEDPHPDQRITAATPEARIRIHHITNPLFSKSVNEECSKEENEMQRKEYIKQLKESIRLVNRLRPRAVVHRGPALRESGGFRSLANIHDENKHDEEIITKNPDKIGGIPREFLDLRHFNPKKFPEESAHVIDCTDENAVEHLVRDSFRDEHVLGGFEADGSAVPGAREGSGCSAQKHAANRINIRNAPLPHVNGTYIQEGTYNGAPLFVRVGPPRKFMGKWDCCVVLRRESDSAAAPTAPLPVIAADVAEGVWKIGLVPAHTITHPRLIGYYEASEKGEGEPPAMGWKVFQEGGKGRGVGGLRILYEE